MAILVINEDSKSEIQRVVKHAKEHVYSLDDLFDIKNGRLEVPGDDPAFVCVIPDGFRCVFTIENQPSGKYRHLSVSVSRKNKLPSVPAMEAIMEEFGFDGKIENSIVNTEDDVAINVLEKMVNQ